MVKRITTLCILMMLFCLSVSAVTMTPFILNADTKESTEQSLKEELIGTAVNMNYKDGYIFIIQNTDNTEKISYYGSDYKLIKSVEIENNIIIEGATYQNYIYLLANNVEKDTNNGFKILKLNENLEVVKEFLLSGKDLEKIRYYEYFDLSKYGMPFMSIVDDKIHIMAFDEKNEQEVIIHINLDLTNYEVGLFDDENLKTDFVNHYNMGIFIGEMLEKTGIRRNYVSSDSNDKYKVFGTFNSIDNSEETTEDTSDPDNLTYLTLVDNNNNKIIFDKSFDSNKEYKAIINVKLIDNYIVAIGLKSQDKSSDFERQILVFDLEGNIVQTIGNDTIYSDLIPDKTGFAVSRNDKVTNESEVTYNNYIEFYGRKSLQNSEVGLSGVPNNSNINVSSNTSFNFVYIIVFVVIVLIIAIILVFMKKKKQK